MKKRPGFRFHSYLSGLLILMVWAQPLRSSPSLGAVVQTWHYDATTKTVTIRVVNTSGKDITAFNLSVTVKYADGTSNFSERSEELLPSLIAGRDVFLAGTGRDEVIPETRDVIDVMAVVDLVAYSDLTADVGNNRAFTHLLTARKGDALAMKKANAVIQQMLADPNISNPGISSAIELERLVAVFNAKKYAAPDDPEGYQQGTLARIARELRRAPTASVKVNQTEGDYLKAMVSRHEDHIAKITRHTQLRQGGAGQ